MKVSTLAALCTLLSTSLANAQTLTEQQAASGVRQADQGSVIAPAAEPHFKRAEAASAGRFNGALALCNQGRPQAYKWPLPSYLDLRGDALLNGQPPEPARIFDNFYYVGTTNVSAFALVTADGIVVIDTLNNGKEAETQIAGGLRHFGLDPAKIRAIVVTHGHGDHYGGAAALSHAYGSRVMMSGTDWVLAPTTRDKPFFDPAPPHDLDIADGQQLRLGDETISMFITPGHTPGTVSLVFPVTDKGVRHMVALWGGTGFNFPHSPDRFAIYARSAQRFAALAAAAGADVFVSNHPEMDSVRFKLRALAARGPGDPNPFVIGKAAVADMFTTLSECATAYGEQVRANGITP